MLARNQLKLLAIGLLSLGLVGCFGSGQARILPAYTPPDPPPLPTAKPVPPPGVPPSQPQFAARPASIEVQALAQPVTVEAPAKSPAPPSGPSHYTVKSGDTASAIARRFELPLQTFAGYNKLSPPYQLRVGQRLKVPSQRRHQVAKGETVYGLALRYDSDLISLVQLNGLAPPYSVQPGQVLLIPDRGDAVGGHIMIAGADEAETVPKTPSELRVAATPKVPLPDGVPGRKPAQPGTVSEPPPLAGESFSWPVKGQVILGFGPRGGGQQNDGINIAAPRGTPVRAAENGVVAYTGNELRGFGNLVLIKHRGGWTTAYAHVERILVSRGETVKRGQLIGRVGTSGNVDRPQLHFEVRQGARAVDPVKKLGGRTATSSGGSGASSG
ncbi:MAG: M23 family metallopeptidase [Pseudomonadota bacterium]